MMAKTTANLGKTAMSYEWRSAVSFRPRRGHLTCLLPQHPRRTAAQFPESSALAPYETASDFALIDANGDRRAMLLLYRRHGTNVYRFAFRLVGDDGTAEEVVSEVFVQVWRNASSFEGRSKVLTWMLAMARQRVLRAMRLRSPVGPFGIAAR
jgi:hypothetical protein